MTESVELLLVDLDNLRPHSWSSPKKGQGYEKLKEAKKRKLQKQAQRAPKKAKISPRAFLDEEAYEGKTNIL